ncbi:hypothetical protein ADIARSV_0521 [Arcticibacter svalbardensis MN12-7]|uniref:T9SS C-terminal target domain-containing protein n=1 Tax=Arcticibacter svalbardensis MN12-7 TaxID=1150600 RepID=R9GX01_9SPHI|nr:hypothetical protein [Arcticibacter svalbardensis]EOR96286.1 hypothetical protein ADIARSV_0521 [Arcticibacter svalbardensis MN12-7]
MKKNILLTFLSILIFASACKKDRTNGASTGNFNRSTSASLEDNRNIPDITQVLPNIINTSTTLTNDRVWILDGPTFVLDNAILTIEPGTYIKGKKKVLFSSKPSFLVITRGAKIIASGTESSPIVFTSDQVAGQRAASDWGGLVLLGNGRTNVTITSIVEGMQLRYTLDLGLPESVLRYGGYNEADNSGSLQYVRIEFAGDVVEDGDELNSLTLAGVGSGTILDHIQVSYGADDAFAMFGGAVNGKYLISFGNNDDDFDFDQGYQGSLQFCLAVKVPCLGESINSNGIESDNISAPSTPVDANRITLPVLSNFTVLGGQNTQTTLYSNSFAGWFRVYSGYRISNSILAGLNVGIDISGATTTSSFVGNSLIHGFTAATSGSPFTSVTTSTASNVNSFIRLANPFNTTICSTTKPIPDFRYQIVPIASPAASGADFSAITVTHPGGSLATFDTTPVYKGAFGSTATARWDDNWATYTPQQNPYL